MKGIPLLRIGLSIEESEVGLPPGMLSPISDTWLKLDIFFKDIIRRDAVPWLLKLPLVQK